jgi:uncharacterized protein
LRPRPSSNTGPLLATVLVAVLVVVVGAIGFIAADDHPTPVADVGYEEPVPTGTRESRPAPTTEESDPPTGTPTGTTTRQTPTRQTPTRQTPTGPRPVYSLGDNPLFAGDVATPAVTCQLTRWETTPQGAEAFFTSALPCLEAAWRPVMRRANLPFFPPTVEFPTGTTWSSPCGSVSTGGGAVAAFYCGENNTLYMPFAGLQTELYGAHPGVYLAVLAHEYGHHVQAMSGVLDAYATERYEAGADTEPGLELSRRLELQAQCFSGMFFAAVHSRGSVDDTILAEARASQDRGDHHPGAPRDHGTDAHSSSWWEQGAQKNRTFQCNTWLSPPGDVE